MFDLIGEGVSKSECLGLGESYKICVCVCLCVCVCRVGSRDTGGGEQRLCRGGMWLEG